MDYYGFDRSLIADIKPTFGEQGRVNAWAAKELGLREGIPVTYRAGDQPHNALSMCSIRESWLLRQEHREWYMA